LLTLHGYIGSGSEYPLRRHLTLKLGKNISIDGKGEQLQQNGVGGVRSLVKMTGYASTLVLEPGSEITGYDGTLASYFEFAPVYFAGDTYNHGEYTLIINGGTVHDNTFDTYAGYAYAAIDVRRYGSGVFFTFSHAEGLREEDVFFNNTGNRNLYFAGSRVAWD
jgi:hypothetical protein